MVVRAGVPAVRLLAPNFVALAAAVVLLVGVVRLPLLAHVRPLFVSGLRETSDMSVTAVG